MPGYTYESIHQTILSFPTNTVTISNIPQTFTDLRLVIGSARSETTPNNTGDFRTLSLRYNGDTGTNYAGFAHSMLNNLYASTTNLDYNQNTSATNANDYYRITPSTLPPQLYTTIMVDIFNYSNTSYNKCIYGRVSRVSSDFGQSELVHSTARYNSTSAITSITAFNLIFSPGTKFTLYGILKG